MRPINPYLGLVLVAFLWGTSFPVLRIALQTVSAPAFVATRFALAGIIFSTVLFFPKVRRETQRILWPGLWIGILNFFIFTSQTIALETISGPRAAFITGTYVVFVPMLARAFGRPSPVLLDWVSAVLAFIGLSILAAPFQNGSFSGLLVGDFFALACAAFAAVKLHTLTRLAQSGAHPLAIAFLQIAGVILVWSLLWPGLPEQWTRAHWTPAAVACVLYCAWGITLGSFYLQSYCQRYVIPQQSALILCLEPVFATLLSLVITGEQLPWNGLVGASCILLAQILGPFFQLRRKWQRIPKVD